MKRAVLIIATAALTTLALGVTKAVPTAVDIVPAAGTGETLILVIAGQYASRDDALARQARVNARLGELDGLSVDAAEHYALRGVLVQRSPDSERRACTRGECPDGVTHVRELRPVRLEHLPKQREPSVRLRSGATLVLTAFRTKRGAQEFMELARTLGVRDLTVVQARKLGGGPVGVGQEPDPDGSGPLERPLPDQSELQE